MLSLDGDGNYVQSPSSIEVVLPTVLRGVVRDIDGNPVSDAWVQLKRGTEVITHLRTDAVGQYEGSISMVNPGKHQLSAFHNSHGMAKASLDLQPGREQSLDLELQPVVPQSTPITSPHQWRHYTHVDGLMRGRVFCILEDSQGYLWFGSSGGLSRFDGARFHTYTERDGLEGSVYTIFEDSDGYLWVGTSEGASRFDGKEFVHFNTQDGLAFDGVNAIHEDRLGNMWFGTGQWWWESGNGISRYDGTYFETFPFESLGFPTQVRLLPGPGEGTGWQQQHEVRDIIQDHWGDIWIATGQGISRYDGETFRSYTNNDTLYHNYVMSICEDSSHSLWFGDGLGWVYRYDGHQLKEQFLVGSRIRAAMFDSSDNLWLGTSTGAVKYDGSSIESYTTENGLPYSSVYSLCEDSAGNMWFGLDDGVICYDSGSFQDYTHHLNTQQVRDMHVDQHGRLWLVSGPDILRFEDNQFQVMRNSGYMSAIHEDRAGNLWFGRGNRYICYDGTVWQTFPSKASPESQISLSYFEDSQGRVWFVPGQQGIDYYDGHQFQTLTTSDGLIEGPIVTVVEDRDGYLWFGSSEHGVCRYDGQQFVPHTTEDGLSDNHINWVLVDHSGKLWFATENGVSCYDGSGFETFGTEHGLGHRRVDYVWEDSKETLWFCTWGGLTRYGGIVFETFTTEDGLASNSIRTDPNLRNSISEDHLGNLWFVGRGVTKYDGTCFQAFSSKDGLVSNNVWCLAEDTDGSLWVGMEQGLTKHVPDAVPPRVSVVGITGDQAYSLEALADEPVTFSFHTTRLTFRYEGSDLRTRTGQLWYQCQLAGVDVGWQKPHREEHVDYHNLRPGRYEFQVRSIDRDLNYSEAAGVAVTIFSAPFYRRTGFIIGSFALLGSVLAAVLSQYIRRRQQVHAYERYAAQELQDARQMQMSLMPEHAPVIHGAEIAGKCVTANTVGGDFFAYVAGNGPNQLGLVIADVSGKAMRGAMNAVMTDGILHMALRDVGGVQPAELLQDINDVLTFRMESDMNVTMVICLLDTQSMTLTLANAAHHAYPLLVSDGQVIELKSRGLPLGMRAGVEYREETFGLQSGDILVLMTDGIIESHDAEGRMYGESGRLEHVLTWFTADMTAEAMVDAVIQDAIDYSSGQRDDDITVVVAKIEAIQRQ